MLMGSILLSKAVAVAHGIMHARARPLKPVHGVCSCTRWPLELQAHLWPDHFLTFLKCSAVLRTLFTGNHAGPLQKPQAVQHQVRHLEASTQAGPSIPVGKKAISVDAGEDANAGKDFSRIGKEVWKGR